MRKFWLVGVLVLVSASVAFAEAIGDPPMSDTPLLDPVAWIGFLGPILVFLFGQMIARIPQRWRAMIAGAIGLFFDVLIQLATDSEMPAGVITAMSGLALMVREMWNQNVTRPIKEGPSL